MFPLFAGSLELSFLDHVLQEDLFVVLDANDVSFIAQVNDEAEIFFEGLSLLVFWSNVERDSSSGAWIGASGGSDTDSVIFLNKAGTLDLLRCRLRFSQAS